MLLTLAAFSVKMDNLLRLGLNFSILDSLEVRLGRQVGEVLGGKVFRHSRNPCSRCYWSNLVPAAGLAALGEHCPDCTGGRVGEILAEHDGNVAG